MQLIKYRNGTFLVLLCYTPNVFSNDFDAEKSEWTKENRGIDFIEARQLWNDPLAVEGPGNSVRGEERCIKVGQYDGKVWSVIFTYRTGLIRVISIRPSRKEEKETHHG